MQAYIFTKNKPGIIDKLVKTMKALGVTPTPLIGSFDSVVDVNVDNEEDLYNTYSRPLSLIDGCETNTVIAVKTWEKESKDTVLAYTFIKIQPQWLVNDVFKALKNMMGIVKISVVFGQEDILVKIASDAPEDLKRILQNIWNINGVERTSTFYNYNLI